VNTMENLAYTYYKLRKPKDAEELQKIALDKYIQIWGADHPKTASARNRLVKFRNALKKQQTG
jgi:hypothetical protein